MGSGKHTKVVNCLRPSVFMIVGVRTNEEIVTAHHLQMIFMNETHYPNHLRKVSGGKITLAVSCVCVCICVGRGYINCLREGGEGGWESTRDWRQKLIDAGTARYLTLVGQWQAVDWVWESACLNNNSANVATESVLWIPPNYADITGMQVQYSHNSCSSENEAFGYQSIGEFPLNECTSILKQTNPQNHW